jgi:hypothetical protein
LFVSRIDGLPGIESGCPLLINFQFELSVGK